MTGDTPSWGALALACWPLWFAYGVLIVVGVSEALTSRRRTGRPS